MYLRLLRLLWASDPFPPSSHPQYIFWHYPMRLHQLSRVATNNPVTITPNSIAPSEDRAALFPIGKIKGIKLLAKEQVALRELSFFSAAC